MKKVDKTLLKNVTAIDLFCGIGGFRYAVSSFGGNVVFASEADKKTANIYAQNFGFVPNGDITIIDENTIPTTMFCVLDFRVNHSRSLENNKALRTPEERCFSILRGLQRRNNQKSYCLKTCIS